MLKSKIKVAFLKKLVQEAGFCVQIPCESSQKVRKWVPLAGELVWLDDTQQLFLGDGKQDISHLKELGVSLQAFYAQDLATLQAHKLWQELQSSARMYELIFKLLPAAIHSEFIAQKPANFSFLVGEQVKKQELASPYWKHYPDYRAVFWRNFDHSSKRDSDGNRFNGVRQTHTLQSHAHTLRGVSCSRLGVKFSSKASLPCNQGRQEPWPAWAKGFSPSLKTRSDKESRPLNACVLALMRVDS